jgi:hypothetical protein
MLGQLIAFAGVCAVLALTPRLDIALVDRNVVKRGRRAGLLAALGTATGLYIHIAGALRSGFHGPQAQRHGLPKHPRSPRAARVVYAA